MASLVLSGNTSGSITISSPSVSGTNTLTLPASTGTIALTAAPTFTGQATIPTINLTGGQIVFPATQSASADANTLDDYEEGTFTPTDVSGAGLTFTSANGYYTKVGRLVTLTLLVVYPSTVNATAAQIGGFPFSNGGAIAGGYLIGSNCGLNLNFRINTGTSTHISSGGTYTAVTNATLSTREVQLVYIMYV